MKSRSPLELDELRPRIWQWLYRALCGLLIAVTAWSVWDCDYSGNALRCFAKGGTSYSSLGDGCVKAERIPLR